MFFFLKQKTAYDMRIRDWSSDVCSSDLQSGRLCAQPPHRAERPELRFDAPCSTPKPGSRRASFWVSCDQSPVIVKIVLIRYDCDARAAVRGVVAGVACIGRSDFPFCSWL